MNFERLTFRRGIVWSARFAPDGHTVVFGAAWEGKPVELFETRVGSTESRSLGFESGSILAVSRAGEMAIALRPRFLAVFNHPGTLSRASLAGGAARELLAEVNAADWSPDGKELAVAHASKGKSLLEFPPGKVIHEPEGVLGDLRFSPDGRLIAFWEHVPSGARVVVVSSDGSGRRVLSDGLETSLPTGWRGRRAGGRSGSPAFETSPRRTPFMPSIFPRECDSSAECPGRSIFSTYPGTDEC